MEMAFKADPMFLIGLMLQIYAENHIQGHGTRAETWSAYEYIDQLDDQKINDIAHKYAEKKGVKSIRLVGDDEQKKEFFEIVYDDPIYKDILFKNLCGGVDGLGVADLKTKTFYKCKGEGEHWNCLWQVLRERYQEEIQRDKAEIENFIMTNFKFIGEYRRLDSYMGNDLDWKWRPYGN